MNATPLVASDPDPAPSLILVATDFSETAQAAIDWAVEIARPHRAKIHLVHGLTLPTTIPDYLPGNVDLGEEVRRAALARLAESAARIAADGGVEVEPDLRIGIPSQAILEAEAAIHPDLIVVGTRGTTGLTHLLLGSTAERVVQRANCPVLTVHPKDAGHHRPIRTVVVPTDFSTDADQAVTTAGRLLHRLQRELKMVLVHAYHLPIEYTAYGPIPTSTNYLQVVGEEAKERLDAMAAELAGGPSGLETRVETVCREGYAPDVIVAEAEAFGADLIAMGTHGRSGLAHLLLGSTAERVVQHAPCPVMTVRRREE